MDREEIKEFVRKFERKNHLPEGIREQYEWWIDIIEELKGGK